MRKPLRKLMRSVKNRVKNALKSIFALFAEPKRKPGRPKGSKTVKKVAPTTPAAVVTPTDGA